MRTVICKTCAAPVGVADNDREVVKLCRQHRKREHPGQPPGAVVFLVVQGGRKRRAQAQDTG